MHESVRRQRELSGPIKVFSHYTKVSQLISESETIEQNWWEKSVMILPLQKIEALDKSALPSHLHLRHTSLEKNTNLKQLMWVGRKLPVCTSCIHSMTRHWKKKQKWTDVPNLFIHRIVSVSVSAPENSQVAPINANLRSVQTISIVI